MPTRQQASEDVKIVVTDFITRGETFTAAHVTMAVRNQGLWAGTLGHERGVAPLVRNLFTDGDMDGYTQTMSSGFYAYHPIGQDPSTVDLRIGGNGWIPRVDRANFSADGDPTEAPSGGQTAPPARTDTPLAKDFYSGGKSASVGDGVRVAYNAQGYAQLPKALTEALGLSGGDGVVLEGLQLSGTCTLRKANDGEVVTARVQNANGALRIRDRALMPFGVGLHEDVTVTLGGDLLTLT